MTAKGGADGVAVAALRAALGLPGVVRAGLALSVVGGRQLRFLPSDQQRLNTADWCLIDSFDRLPLNDAVRTGRAVVVESPSAFSQRYPELAKRAGGAARSLVALPLSSRDNRLGGLLLYLDHETVAPCPEQEALAATVAEQLLALRAHQRLNPRPGAHPLPADATAPRRARELVREALADADVKDSVVDAALLCLSELVTNVVMHADQAPSLSIELKPESLIIRIHHDAEGPSHDMLDVEDDPLRISGRGLELVDALAEDWGSESTESGTTTWFRLDL